MIEEILGVLKILIEQDSYLMAGIFLVSIMMMGGFIILLLIVGIKWIQYGINSYRTSDKKSVPNRDQD